MDGLMALSHRPRLPDDEEFLFRLYACTRTEELAAWGWPPAQQEAFLRMQFRARAQSYAASYSGALHSILLLGDLPVGSAMVWRGPSEFRLVDIAVLPEFRNRGCGAQWISRLISEAAAARIPVHLSVQRGNPAIRLYERLGFVPVDPGPIYIEMEHKPLGTES
jgi:ribosomal protein S18 acetylase RimI-like enzyme